jgi:hypothetical protein
MVHLAIGALHLYVQLGAGCVCRHWHTAFSTETNVLMAADAEGRDSAYAKGQLLEPTTRAAIACVDFSPFAPLYSS